MNVSAMWLALVMKTHRLPGTYTGQVPPLTWSYQGNVLEGVALESGLQRAGE